MTLYLLVACEVGPSGKEVSKVLVDALSLGWLVFVFSWGLLTRRKYEITPDVSFRVTDTTHHMQALSFH